MNEDKKSLPLTAPIDMDVFNPFGGSTAVENRRGDAVARGAVETCQACGRKVVASTAMFVEIVSGGAEYAIAGTADTSDSGYMGCFMLGPECAKKAPKGYTQSVTGVFDW